MRRSTAHLIIIFLVLGFINGLNGKLEQSGDRRHGRRQHYIMLTITNMENSKEIAAFMHSIWQHSPHSKVVAFVGRRNPGSPVSYFGGEEVLLPSGAWHISARRYVHYVDYITSAINEGSMHPHDGVMFTEARDALLQGDPWKHPRTHEALSQNRVLFSLEGTKNAPVNFSANTRDVRGWNNDVVRDCFGSPALERLATCGQCHVICSGVFLGTAASMLATSQALIDTLHKAEPACNVVGRHGTDQGALNFLVYSNATTNFTYQIQPNWDSPVMTMTFANPFTIRKDGFLDTIPSSRPAVIHQYDRYPSLAPMLLNMYPYYESDVRVD